MTYIVKSGGTELVRIVDPAYAITLDVVNRDYSFPDYDPATYTIETEG